jgi:hypothetical protein
MGNEGMIFHEALHGITGLLDFTTIEAPGPQLLEKLGYSIGYPSCTITTYIQTQVLALSLSPTRLDPTDVWGCK